MEIRTRPARGGRRAWVSRGLLAAALLLAVGVLAPAALGFEQHPVGDDGMAGDYGRGALVLGRAVMPEELAVGDVVAFRAPAGEDEGAWVVRRIAGIRQQRLVTHADTRAGPDPWLLAVDAPDIRVVSRGVPWVGYPWLVADAVGPVPLMLLAAGLAVGGLLLRRGGRAAAARSKEPDTTGSSLV